MAPGGTLFRFAPHFGENVLPHGSHEWLPYSKDEVRLKTVNNNLLGYRCKPITHCAIPDELRDYPRALLGQERFHRDGQKISKAAHTGSL